jgi:predicted  nucleic acid-binding Zn-ribbon protein
VADQALLDVAGRLYGGMPGDFTPERTTAEKAARADGDRELAAALKNLKKPSVGAWAVNLLVRREAEQIDQVLALAESLRAAAEALDGEELRALTRQRRQLTSALTTRARQLALELGSRLTQAVADQVEGTLNAAMLDAGAADAVRTGLLVTTISATGLDDSSWESAVAVPSALGTRAAPSEDAAGGSGPALHVVPENKRLLREVAEEKLAEAEAEVAAAQKSVKKAGKAVSDLQGKRFQLRSEIDELQRRIDAIEDQVEGVDEDIEVAEQDAEDAAEALAEAESDRDGARAALDKLG